MRDLILITATALIAITIWIGIEIFQDRGVHTIPQKALELSLPINGRIDIEFINNLSNPADE